MAEPLDPRAAALAEAQRDRGTAIALGLVYVGDQLGRLAVDSAEALSYLDARLIDVVPDPGACAVFTIGGRTFQAVLGETFRVYIDPRGRPDVQIEHGYKEALEKIAKHEEHFGSGPADDEMREIAIGALAAGER